MPGLKLEQELGLAEGIHEDEPFLTSADEHSAEEASKSKTTRGSESVIVFPVRRKPYGAVK